MKHYLAERLPDYMIPQSVVVLESFPLLANGKIDYKALQKIKVKKEKKRKEAPWTKLQWDMALLWKESLGIKTLNLDDNFFDLGGNSLLAMRLIVAIKKKLNTSVPIIRLFQHPSFEAFCGAIQVNEKNWSPVVLMKSKGEKEPFFCVHPLGGNVFCYREIAKHWTANRPFYGIQARGLEEEQMPHDSIEQMAKEYIREILKIQPVGPYFIGGWSYGGLIATEMVRQLQELGEEVSVLIIIDSSPNIEKFQKIDVEDESLLLSELTNHYLGEKKKKKSLLTFKEQFVQFIESGGKSPLRKGQKSEVSRILDLAKANYRALKRFSLPRLDVKTVFIKSEVTKENETSGWEKYFPGLKLLKQKEITGQSRNLNMPAATRNSFKER